MAMRPFILVSAFLATVAAAREFPKAVTWKNSIVPGMIVGLDGNGRVVERIFPDGRIARQQFLDNGLISSQQSPGGTSIDCAYDDQRRLITVTENTAVRQQFFDVDGSVVGWLQGASAQDARRLFHELGLKESGDQLRPVVTGDASGRLQAVSNAIGTVRFAYGSGTLTQTLDTGRWTFAVQRLEAGDATTLYDSTGASFTYHGAKYVTSLEDEGGKRLVTREYDEKGRVVRAVFGQSIVIAYDYAGGRDWATKVVRTVGGQTIATFARRDYPDPRDDGQANGVFRGPTGEPIAEIADGRISYVAGVLTPYAHLTRDGVVEYRSFAFDSAARYSADEIRLMDDGSMVVLPELPHAEETLAARGVYPLRITISPRHETRLSTSGRRIASNLYSLYESCEWIPGGEVIISDGSSSTPGRWDCTTYWVWSPDPSPAPDPSGGGSSGGSYASGSMPPTTAEVQRLNEAKSTANNRLTNNADCAQMFTDLGANGANVIANTTYRDGTNTAKCQSNVDAGAWTEVGGAVVYLCGSQFTNQSPDEAAVIVIHEALHDAGLNENPPDTTAMTSAQISAMVRQKCGLS